MAANSNETDRMIDRARAGDPAAWNDVFARHRERLRRMVQMRLDYRLHGRIDASDVIQDAYLEASRRMDNYLREPGMPVFFGSVFWSANGSSYCIAIILVRNYAMRGGKFLFTAMLCRKPALPLSRLNCWVKTHRRAKS